MWTSVKTKTFDIIYSKMSTYTQLLFEIRFNINNSRNLPLFGPSRACEQLVINFGKDYLHELMNYCVTFEVGSELPNEFSQYDNYLTLFDLRCGISYHRTHDLIKLN